MDPYTKSSYTWWLGFWSKREFSHQPGSESDHTSVTSDSGSGHNTFSGSRNPFWRSQIRNLQNATTVASGDHYSVKRQELFNLAGNLRTTTNPGQSTESSWVGGSSITGMPSLSFQLFDFPDQSIVTDADNRAIRKFISRCEDVQSSFESGQDLGEWKQTVSAVTDPLGHLKNHVLSYFDKLRKLKRKYRRPRDLKKALANAYLEWTFGWGPIVDDIASGVAGLENLANHQVSVPVHASANAQFAGSVAPFGNYSTGTFVTTSKVQQASYYEIRLKGAYRSRCDAAGRIPKSQMLQLDLPHFIPTVWDLLPYSFIVDYFLNVGDIIHALCFRYSDLAWGCKTVRHRFNSKFFITRIDPQTPNSSDFLKKYENFGYICTGGNAETEYIHFVRSVITSLDLIPRLHFHIPAITTKPWRNIAALILAKYKPLRPFF
jgi:hypothetical protein